MPGQQPIPGTTGVCEVFEIYALEAFHRISPMHYTLSYLLNIVLMNLSHVDCGGVAIGALPSMMALGRCLQQKLS